MNKIESILTKLLKYTIINIDKYYTKPLKLIKNLYKYFNVHYLTPSNSPGIHTAVQANSYRDAIIRSPIMLCWGTNYLPSQFTITLVTRTPKEDLPQ